MNTFSQRLDPVEIFLGGSVILAGLFFRLYQLPGQILVDDEWHSVHKITGSGYLEIFSDFGLADHCIPLTLFYEFLLNNFWISETVMRLPSIAAGFLALLAVFFFLKGIVGNRTALATTCLLSISPLHVYYSRLARPYAISMLLSFLAVMAFYFWWTNKGRAWIGVYLVCGAVSVWVLLPSLPFVAGPYLFALIHSFSSKNLRKNLGKNLKRLFFPGLFFGFGILVLLLPPLLQNPEAILGKAGGGSISLESMLLSAELFAGTSSLWLAILVALLAAAGAVILVRKNALFGWYSLLLVALQVAGFILANPVGSSFAILLNRYSIAVVPFFLTWAAMALTHETGMLKFSLANRYSFAMLSLLLLFFGPFREIYFYPNPFTNYAAYQIDYDLDEMLKRIRPPQLPSFYERISTLENGRITLLEAPWHYNDNIYPYYQWRHRQHMVIGFVGDPDGPYRLGEAPVKDYRFRFRNALHVSEFGRIEKRGVDFVVFHRQLEDERKSDIPVIHADVGEWIELYRGRYGEPEYEDEFLSVFRLP